ncbi:heavy-metal-associated domain-containing protein [Halobacillus sp. MO56]
MRIIKLQLEPLTCPSCIKKIEGSLGKIEGVQAAKVLFHSSKVKVQFDESIVSAGELEATIEGLGYPVVSTKVS